MPFVAALSAAAPLISKLGASKAAKKGLGTTVRAISSLKNKATDILQRKKTKAELKAEEAKARAAQFAALAGGTTYSNVKPERMAEKAAFGAKLTAIKQSLNQSQNNQNQTMEKVKEFFTKNWMYVLGGVVLLMFLKKRR